MGKCLPGARGEIERGRRWAGTTRSPGSALSHPFLGEGSPTKIDYRQKGTPILASLLEDLDYILLLRISRESPINYPTGGFLEGTSKTSKSSICSWQMCLLLVVWVCSFLAGGCRQKHGVLLPYQGFKMLSGSQPSPLPFAF